MILKKILIATCLLGGCTTNLFAKQKAIIEIWIAATAKSGWDTPFGTLSWGSDCANGHGVCIHTLAKNPNSDNPFDYLELDEQQNLILVINSENKVAELTEFLKTSQIEFESNTQIEKSITSQFESLDAKSLYFIEAGIYSAKLENGTYTINLNLIKAK